MKKKILKNILAVVLGAALPALATSKEVPPVVAAGAGVVMSLGLLNTRAPKDHEE